MASYSVIDSIKLSKKKFFRAPQWELKLAIRILIGIVVLYFLAAFLFLGVGIYFIAQKSAPEQNPVFLINQFLIYYFGIDLLIRYFVQNLPITDIKPLLIQPISKNKIVQGVLLRSFRVKKINRRHCKKKHNYLFDFKPRFDPCHRSL